MHRAGKSSNHSRISNKITPKDIERTKTGKKLIFDLALPFPEKLPVTMPAHGAVTADGRIILPKDAIATCNEYADWVVEHRQQLPSWFPLDNSREAFYVLLYLTSHFNGNLLESGKRLSQRERRYGQNHC